MHDGCDINAFNILSAPCAYCFVYLFFTQVYSYQKIVLLKAGT